RADHLPDRGGAQGAAGRRGGAQIAGDVPRGEPCGAHRGDADVREVLADPVPGGEHLLEGRGDGGRGGVVGEVGVDERGERGEAFADRPPGGEHRGGDLLRGGAG